MQHDVQRSENHCCDGCGRRSAERRTSGGMGAYYKARFVLSSGGDADEV